MRASIAIAKFNALTVTQAHRHNAREHDTASQVDQRLRFGDNVHATRFTNPEALDNARALAKRKDAVLAVGLSLQLGNSDDWRDQNSMPRDPAPADPKRLLAMAIQFAQKKFGKENIVSVDLHLDETTPHVQILATPIVGGKLNAKHFVGGPAKCAQLRKEFMSLVKQTFPTIQFEEKPLPESGKKHDASKSSLRSRVPSETSEANAQIADFAHTQKISSDLGGYYVMFSKDKKLSMLHNKAGEPMIFDKKSDAAKVLKLIGFRGRLLDLPLLTPEVAAASSSDLAPEAEPTTAAPSRAAAPGAGLAPG